MIVRLFAVFCPFLAQGMSKTQPSSHGNGCHSFPVNEYITFCSFLVKETETPLWRGTVECLWSEMLYKTKLADKNTRAVQMSGFGALGRSWRAQETGQELSWKIQCEFTPRATWNFSKVSGFTLPTCSSSRINHTSARPVFPTSAFQQIPNRTHLCVMHVCIPPPRGQPAPSALDFPPSLFSASSVLQHLCHGSCIMHRAPVTSLPFLKQKMSIVSHQ